jgi:hypothetical protein
MPASRYRGAARPINHADRSKGTRPRLTSALYGMVAPVNLSGITGYKSL